MTASHMNSMLLGIMLAVAGTVPAAEQTENAAAEVRLEYRCEIPDNLPPQIILEEKNRDRNLVETWDIYRTGHRQGWFWVVHGYITKGGEFPENPRDYVQERIMKGTAREIGILEAKAAILKLLLTHKREVVISALKKQFPSWELKGGFYPQPTEEKPREPNESRQRDGG